MNTTTATVSTAMTTIPGEVGQLAGEAIQELVSRVTGNANIATYAEGPSPLSWDVLAESGWDQVGIISDEESASLRDLVEVGRAWGRGGIQLPLLPTILAKRHSARARDIDGPVTLALPSATLSIGSSFIPFGQDRDIPVVLGLGSDEESWTTVPTSAADDTLALTLRGVEAPVEAFPSPLAAREIAVVLASEATGAAERLLDDAVAFAKERKQFGKPIGSFQAVKHHLANALIATEMADTGVIWASTQEAEAFRGSAYAIDQAIQVAELAIQVHGGMGFTWEMGLHFYLRNMLTAREIVAGLRGQHA